MKRVFNFALFLVLAVGILFVAGCGKVDPTKDFKNPKTITIKGDKSTTYVTYDDDDDTYELDESGSEKILKNKEKNFRLSFEFSNDTIKDLKTRRDNFSKDTEKYEVISEVEFNENKGFAIIDKKYATVSVYVFLDEEKDIAFVAKVSDMNPSETEKTINEKGAKEALYNKTTVQQILKTINYKK